MSERMRLKELIISEMGGFCVRCGYDEFPEGLVFHHVEQCRIDKGPSLLSREELDECVLLCVPCHNALHACRWSGEFEKAPRLGYRLLWTT